MSYHEYWELSPWLVRSYHEANKQRINEQNTFLWLQGRYFYEGISAALSNFSKGLAGKRGQAEYRKEPYRLFPKTEEEERAEQRKQIEAYREHLLKFQQDFNKRKEKKKDAE